MRLVDRNHPLRLAELDDHAGVGVEEHLAVRAAKHGSRNSLTLYPGDTTPTCVHPEELLGEVGSLTVGAGHVLDELVLDPLRRGDHILVPLNRQSAELGVELVKHTALRHEFGKRSPSSLRHVEMVAEWPQ